MEMYFDSTEKLLVWMDARAAEVIKPEVGNDSYEKNRFNIHYEGDADRCWAYKCWWGLCKDGSRMGEGVGEMANCVNDYISQHEIPDFKVYGIWTHRNGWKVEW